MTQRIGSQWRRWDLHFHTPASFDYRGSPSPEDLVNSLLDHEVAAVAITDHHTMDVEFIREMRRVAASRMTVFPGIEFRSECGTKPIHYIAIFPETSDLNRLWEQLRVKLALSRDEIDARGGDEGIYVNLRDAHEVVRDLRGIFSIHAGGKSNSIEGIENYEQFQRRLKLDITEEYVDLLEVGQLKDVLSYLDVVFPATGLDLPLIIGSDNHNIPDYEAPQCWLKADTTFIGLRQVLNEPRSRTYLGEMPDQLRNVERSPTFYIRSLALAKRPLSPLTDNWFDGAELGFNPGLIAVIGNQGSGKSALTDILGLLGNCPYHKSFAFLSPEQFRHPKSGKAEHFQAVLTWADGLTAEKPLDSLVQAGAHESIRYLPQFHLDAICDELKGGHGGQFEEALKHVIFSRVPGEQRANQADLDSLIKFRTRAARGNITSIQTDLVEAAEDYVTWQARTKPAYRTSIEEVLEARRQQLKVHREAEPVEVPAPREEPDSKQLGLREELATVNGEIAESDDAIERAREDLTTTNALLDQATQVRGSLNSLQSHLDKVKARVAADLRELGLAFENLVSFNVNCAELEDAVATLMSRRAHLEGELDETVANSSTATRKHLLEQRSVVKEALDLPGRLYEAYQQALREWSDRGAQIEGTATSAGTVKYFEARLAELERAGERLDDARKKLFALAERILDSKKEVLTVSEDLHDPVRKFINEHPIAGKQFGLDFFVSFVPRDFSARVLNFINQARRGSYYGDEEGEARLAALVKQSDFTTAMGVLAFLREVLTSLEHDHRRADKPAVYLDEQVRQGFDPDDLLRYVFGLDYLEPQFELRWHGRPLDQLSPGERGTLLLIFFLLVDDARTPLVIDQPEGNLDNQTVYEVLVECIKDAKHRRQIVIVTHNPNLAVVCDAEQVVLVTMDKANGHRVEYTTGSLEDPEIGKRLVDILEGTRPAIEKRMAKYQIIFD